MQHDQEWEDTIMASCRLAGLDPIETEVVLRHLFDGLNAKQIRWKLASYFVRTSDVTESLHKSLKRLSALDSCREVAREFERSLVPCAENRDDYDERPADMSGVTPDRSSDRFQGSRLVPRDDARVRQDPRSAVILWARSKRPWREAVPAPV